ncbi:MAG TPA: hypothetical protein P5531_02760 [Bacteroidales bacterium]|nr:hypothetical protein [Bacteroidales bacterium]HSA42560.1 hypothetical protein [Bacteroidales bacterium]
MKNQSLVQFAIAFIGFMAFCGEIIAQEEICLYVNNNCQTSCTAPIKFQACIYINDESQYCYECEYISYIPTDPDHPLCIEFNNCEAEPEGDIVILIHTEDTNGHWCCAGEYEGHWNEWGEVFEVDLENWP